MMTQTRILFVCPGNDFRSRLALGAMRHLIAEEDRLDDFLLDAADTVESPTRQMPGTAMLTSANRNHIWFDDHRARAIAAHDFKLFDLMLAMDQASKDALEAAAPVGTSQKVHLLLDFAPWIGSADFPQADGLDADAFDDLMDFLHLALRGLLEVIDQATVDFNVPAVPRARLKVASGT